MSKYIGKYVCYDQADGGACWGRIKDEAKVNTPNGEKEVFILEDRYVRYQRTGNLKNFRRFYPDMASPDFDASSGSKAVSLDKNDELFFEVRKVRGDSTLRKESINLETDILDLEEVLEAVTESMRDMVFKALLGSGPVRGKTAREIGIQALLRHSSLSDEAKGVLRERLGLE